MCIMAEDNPKGAKSGNVLAKRYILILRRWEGGNGVRYNWVKGCALVLMGVMLAAIAACGDKTKSASVHGNVVVENNCTVPEKVDHVLDGVYDLYPEDGPELPALGVVDNMMIAYHMPGMEHVHGYILPVQFSFEYLYSGEGMMEELDWIRSSLHDVEYDDANIGRIFLTGTAGPCIVNVTAFLKEGPDSLHYSVEMPEEYVDIEAFLKKIRVGPIGDMIYESIGDVEYARNAFATNEQWVWGYLTEANAEEAVAWYRKQAEDAGYEDITVEPLSEGMTHIHTQAAGNRDAWTAQVQETDRGYTYVSFIMVHTDT